MNNQSLYLPCKANKAGFSSASNEWFSPLAIAVAARRVLGDIDLDPASCEQANTIIQAKKIYTIYEGGLSKSWFGTVFLNPPGGLLGKFSQAALWWDKLLAEYKTGSVDSAIFIAFNAEIVRMRQDVFDFPICFPSARLKFLKNVDGVLTPDPQPTKFNAIVHLPSRDRDTASAFCEHFSTLGRVVIDNNKSF